MKSIRRELEVKKKFIFYVKMENMVTQCTWIPYDFVLVISLPAIICSVAVTVLFILFKNDQNKADVGKDKIEKVEW